MKIRVRIPNAKPVVKKHLERTARFKWEEVLEDPRAQVNREWSFNYLMNVLWHGMLSGCKNLRAVEDFSECCNERIPDTTLHDFAIKVSPEPLRIKLVQEVKKALRAHELPKEEFPIRITAIDGKCVSVSRRSVGDFSQKSESNGKVYFINRVLRAVHVSNTTKLILGQREICGKMNEMSEFKHFLKELVENYRNTNLLEVISVDAGMISEENATFTVNNGLDYIMALKNPQKRLVDLAHDLLGHRVVPDKKTEEQASGKRVIRRLYRCKAPDYPGWPHLKEFWRIAQETTESSGKVTVEERYFVTSLNPEKLTHLQVLKAIRMHWGIENNANWVVDTAWEEDDSPWCNRAFVFVSHFRMLAYNVLARLRTRRFRKKNDRARTWKGIMTLINAVLLLIQHEIETKKTVIAFE